MLEWGGENARMLECGNARMERENISYSRQWQLAVESGEVRECGNAGMGWRECANARMRECANGEREVC